MAKPHCHFYPGEVARRQCPAVGKPISARACCEKYVVEVDCPSNCPYFASAIRYDGERVYQRLARRIKAEYPAVPAWTERPGVVFFVGVIETILARFAQWFPILTDRDARDVVEDLWLDIRSQASGLQYSAKFQSGYLGELRKHLDRKLSFLASENGTVNGVRVEDERKDGEALVASLEGSMDRFRELMDRHAGSNPRAYLEFIIPFFDKMKPKPSAVSRLILPGGDSF